MYKKINSRYVGFFLLALIVLFAFLTPLFTGIDPDKQDLLNTFAEPSQTHLLGTDQFGRDMLTRLSFGTQLSFGLSLFIVITSVVPGVLIGLLVAFKGGIVDKFFTLFSDMILALPGLLLVLLFVAFAPGDLLFLYLGLSLSFWIEFFRVTRAKTKTILIQPYIESTRLLGFSTFYIIKKEVLPQLYATLITLSTFSMSAAIISISTLSAINVGIRPPTAELGNMIVELMPYFDESPLLALYPCVVIFVLVLSLQLISKRAN